MAQIKKELKEDAENRNRKVVSIHSVAVAMCFDCMIAKGYKRDKGFHTAVIKHCVGCGAAKHITPKRYWSK